MELLKVICSKQRSAHGPKPGENIAGNYLSNNHEGSKLTQAFPTTIPDIKFLFEILKSILHYLNQYCIEKRSKQNKYKNIFNFQAIRSNLTQLSNK